MGRLGARQLLSRTLPALVAATAVVLAQASPANAAAEPRSVAELEAAFGVGQQKSDFVVVIDTSGSMDDPPDNLYPKVRDALATLVKAIPAGNRLSLITFDSFATLAFDGPITDANRAGAMKLPDRLGAATDIGRALNSAVERLDRADAAAIQTVIFVTDGAHEARADSEYRTPGSAAWNALRSRAAGVESRKSIAVRALALSDAGKSGAELVDSVFSNVEIARLSGAQLGEYLTGQVRKAQLRVLARAVEQELERGVQATVSDVGRLGSRVKVKVRLQSSLPHLGVDVDLKSVTAKDSAGRRVRSFLDDDTTRVHIAPGAAVDVEVLLRPNVGATSFFDRPPPRPEEIDVQLSLGNAVVAAPAVVLREDLGVDPAVKVQNPQTFTVARTVGRSWAQFGILVLALLIALVLAIWVWYRFLARPRLPGELILQGAPGAQPLKLRGKKTVIDAKSFGRADRGSKVRLYTRRGRRGVVFAERLGEKGSFDKQVGPRWKPHKARTPLSLVVYRLDGEGGTRFRWRLKGEDS